MQLVITGSIKAAHCHYYTRWTHLKPLCSNTCMAEMVVPEGEHTSSFSWPGCLDVSSTILAAPCDIDMYKSVTETACTSPCKKTNNISSFLFILPTSTACLSHSFQNTVSLPNASLHYLIVIIGVSFITTRTFANNEPISNVSRFTIRFWTVELNTRVISLSLFH